jgi:hypothetical protein
VEMKNMVVQKTKKHNPRVELQDGVYGCGVKMHKWDGWTGIALQCIVADRRVA